MVTLQTNKILIPVDFTENGYKAIRHAAFLAKITKGDLILLHVKPKKEIHNISSPVAELREVATPNTDALQQLTTLCTRIQKKYLINVIPVMTSGNCRSEIAKAAVKYGAGLIVMGTRGAESSSSLFFGSNALRVIAKSEIPVLTVRTETNKIGYSRILLPIDSSAHSRQKVNAAIQLAKMFAASVHVLGILGEDEENYKYKMKVIISQIKKLVEEKNLSFASRILKSDNPARLTLAYSRQIGADLIVTMTDQNTGYSRFAFGTFDEQLVDESNIPVLSIQPEIHEEDIPTMSLSGVY